MRRSEASRTGSFLGAAQLQGIVIGALMLRELHTRYGRDNLGFVWMIVEPLFLCVGVIGIWLGAHGRYEHGIPILAFVVTGYLPLTLWRHITFRSVLSFRANASLLYHRQVKMLDLMLARILIELYGTIIAYVVVAFVFWSFDMYEFPKDWGLFYLGWFYFLLFSTSIGLIIGSLSEMYEWVEKLVNPFMYFMLPICGVFYMVDWLPDRFQHMALYVPTVNAFELVRAGQFGVGTRTHYDIPYVTFFCLSLLALGLILSRKVHHHLVFE